MDVGIFSAMRVNSDFAVRALARRIAQSCWILAAMSPASAPQWLLTVSLGDFMRLDPRTIFTKYTTF